MKDEEECWIFNIRWTPIFREMEGFGEEIEILYYPRRWCLGGDFMYHWSF